MENEMNYKELRVFLMTLLGFVKKAKDLNEVIAFIETLIKES